MLMKVFPHGTGEGDKPSRYLVRPDYPGRDTAPPHVLRGDPAMTRALIDSIERRWKFTSGVLSWHPDEKISEAQEEEVIDAFECVAFAGLDADQRNILLGTAYPCRASRAAFSDSATGTFQRQGFQCLSSRLAKGL